MFRGASSPHVCEVYRTAGCAWYVLSPPLPHFQTTAAKYCRAATPRTSKSHSGPSTTCSSERPGSSLSRCIARCWSARRRCRNFSVALSCNTCSQTSSGQAYSSRKCSAQIYNDPQHTACTIPFIEIPQMLTRNNRDARPSSKSVEGPWIPIRLHRHWSGFRV